MKTLLISPKPTACLNASGLPCQADAKPLALTDWIQRIHQAWTEGADRALELGRLMCRARRSLPRGSWSRLWESGGLPFSQRKGQMLVVIGQGVGELNAQNSARLPVAWNTLYYVARLGQTRVEQLIRRGRIHPELSLRQAQSLLAEYRPGALRAIPHSKPENRLARWITFVRAEMRNWSVAERTLVRKRLLDLAEEIQRLESRNGSRTQLSPLPSRRLTQFMEEHLASPAVPVLISQTSQRRTTPVLAL